MIAVLNWSIEHWYVWFWLAVFGVFESVRDFFLAIFETVAGIGERKHRRRMKELKLQAKIAAAPALPAAKPGPCVHRNVTAIVAAGEDEPCAWLCRCGER